MTGLSGIVSAQALNGAMNKHIYIGSPAQTQALQVDFMPEKSSFTVNEAIKFNIRGNKRFFLFLFNIDYANNEAYMILPNDIQTAERNMYLAGQSLQVPNANAEFYSDRPGNERIVMIATTKYPKEISLNKFRRAGKFYMTEAKTVQAQLKRIQLREEQIRSTTAEEVYIKEFDLPIHTAGSSTTINTAETIAAHDYNSNSSAYSVILPASKAFVSMDRINYKSGDPLTISFGVDQDAYATLYTKDIRGHYEFLAERKVEANVMNSVNGYAGRKGVQEVMTVFSKNKGYKAETNELKSHSNAAQAKGFIIAQNSVQTNTMETISTTPIATAIASFRVY